MMKPFFSDMPFFWVNWADRTYEYETNLFFLIYVFSISGAVEIVLHFSKKQKQFHVQIEKNMCEINKESDCDQILG